jgi:hypothetical protein
MVRGGPKPCEEGDVKIEPDAVLVCTACGVEGSHELLYLSDHVSASRCESCGAARMFTGQLYADYARDVAERRLRLPCSLAVRRLGNPLEVLGWPIKIVKKPFGLLRELDRVATLDRVYRRGSSGRVRSRTWANTESG